MSDSYHFDPIETDKLKPGWYIVKKYKRPKVIRAYRGPYGTKEEAAQELTAHRHSYFQLCTVGKWDGLAWQLS